MQQRESGRIQKLATGIPGFDLIAKGGLTEGRTTLVSGTAGSGKTVFGSHFVAGGILENDQNGVFVTCEESPRDIRINMAAFDWNIAAWEAEGRFAFVDVSRTPGEVGVFTGEYDLGALLARIEHAIRKIGAKRVCVDSLGALFSQFSGGADVRSELFRIAATLKEIGVTTVMTAERNDDYGPISRYGIEEFVSDNVIVLRNVLENEKRRRTIEILKCRGTSHQKGEFPFTIMPDRGATVIPLSAMELKQHSSNLRISSGCDELDAMCGGGLFRDSVILVSGATGTGKTLTVTHFVGGGAANGERCLLLGFEESREQLCRNANGWGFDFAQMEQDGNLKIISEYPETTSLEDHLIDIKAAIHEFRPNRVAIDSLSALERVATVKGFREFVIALTSFIKHEDIAGLFTSTTPTLLGGTSVTDSHISTITDTIILLRYVEMDGDMRRGLTVLKMRGARHDTQIHEFTIDGSGMHIGEPFHDVSGILSGNPVHRRRARLEEP